MWDYNSPRRWFLVGLVVITGVASVLTSCKLAPTTSTIITKVRNPDGRAVAALVDRYTHTARVSDGFFIVVAPNDQNFDAVVNSRHLEDYSAFVATSASKVQLKWKDSSTLLVLCESCGINAIDIAKRLNSVPLAKIVYLGFPEHTAYS